ncbi:hypothetical protein SARC_08435 [Sphaeroforma arctica JP610]|uniref:Uncharacterized protein n=1 Tax=Sphaeroforma arctica JP610 TaxID=667725 RepID=A0A0L0FQW3_9EUKA|nr:hypothetical protein SARC_08435 [Sphaeroforma arctica JP610]KNC79155.1 hypothetical protein SARC_08435 [Sphaeroforma arctica JP610]|eukprot:XP_014153057.1 hypothetical protein SARC_08435 [Sphaeroforma arctica JP610]
MEYTHLLNMERSRRPVVNKEAAERALAYLKLLDCDTLLSILPTVNKLVIDTTTLALTRYVQLFKAIE